jgi:5'-methylthioadenosine phosphorylase
VWALRELGARSVIAICTTGGVDEAFGPGTIVCPDQIVDYTTGREHTYSDGLDGRPVEHVEFTLPFGDGLRRRLLAAAGDCGVTVVDGGCYGCVNGPRLETAAEIRMLARDGCSLVGQTMMPEAGLAREAGLEYAALCPVVNHAAGVGSSRQGIERSVLRATREATMERVMQVLLAFARDHAAPPAPGEAA